MFCGKVLSVRTLEIYRENNIVPLLGFEPRIVQPIAVAIPNALYLHVTIQLLHSSGRSIVSAGAFVTEIEHCIY